MQECEKKLFSMKLLETAYNALLVGWFLCYKYGICFHKEILKCVFPVCLFQQFPCGLFLFFSHFICLMFYSA